LFKAVTDHRPSRQRTLRLRCGDHPSGYFDLILTYLGATLLIEPAIGLPAPVNNRDYEILYDEVDIDSSGLYTHSLLLWPEGEIAIRFSGFTFVQTGVADRDAP
jgi:hypothetical protein